MAKQAKRPPKTRRKPPAVKRHGATDVPVVGIGASAGGLEAFTKLLQHLPSDTGMAFVLIQHLDPTHESMLASLLGRATSMPVREVKHRMRVTPNHVFVSPPNVSVTLEGAALLLSRRMDKGRQYMPIDGFFSSLVASRNSRAIGVILSGTASDGTVGLREIKAAGGITFAQDQSSAKFDGMPRNAIAAGVVDYVLRPQDIGRELARIGHHPFMRPGWIGQELHKAGRDDLSKIFNLLRAQTGADFSRYKRGTIERRLRRRMALARSDDIGAYVKVLQESHDEVRALYEDLLINVTEFFRDPKTFEILKANIFPELVKDRKPDSSIRIWTPGCSTGQETYSIAMLLADFLTEHGVRNPVQVFGTDLSATAVSKARAGLYPETALKGVPADYLHRFFIKVEHGYRVSKRIREICVFARQDLGKDPPFSRMDLISCRNVLIYLGQDLQSRLIPMFHYALNANGYLLLGKSETVGASPLFTLADKSQRIYLKQPGTHRPPADVPFYDRPRERGAPDRQEPEAVFDLQEEADRIVLARYGPPGVIVNQRMEILQFRGDMSPYLRPASGPASLNSLKLLRGDIVTELHAAIDLAARGTVPVRRERLHFKLDGARSVDLDIEIIPIDAASDGERPLLVLFEPAAPREREVSLGPEAAGSAASAEIVRLQHDLAASRKHLKFLMDERQAAEEELRSANEEILSSNEELQSTNEELGTSQEELQSANEELSTVNDELQSRNTELGRLGNDLRNLLHSVSIPIVMLGNDLHVRRFTPTAGRVMNLRAADVGRPITEIKSNLEIPDLEKLLSGVVEDLAPRELDVRDRDGAWYSLRIRPYRTEDHKIDGVVMVLYDVDQLKRSLEEVRLARDFSEAIVETIPGPLVILDSSLKVLIANRAFYETYHLSKRRTEGFLLTELAGGQFNLRALQENLHRALPENRSFEAIEIEGRFQRLGHRILSVAGRCLELGDQRKILLVVMADLTERKRSEEQMRTEHSTLEKSLQHAESSLRESEVDLRQNRGELRALTARLLATQEEERRRVSRELHDDLNQRLAMLEVDAERLGQQLPASSDVKKKLRSLQTRVADVSNDIRRVAYQLHPSILDHLGLAVALRSYCSEFSKREKIRVQLSTEGSPDRLPEAIALCLYRVAQESLRNVAKHSSAKSARVRLQEAEKGIRLSIRDDGAGFDPAAQTLSRGIGLLSMKERMRLVDGKFSVKSKPGKGTGIDVWAPLSEGS